MLAGTPLYGSQSFTLRLLPFPHNEKQNRKGIENYVVQSCTRVLKLQYMSQKEFIIHKVDLAYIYIHLNGNFNVYYSVFFPYYFLDIINFHFALLCCVHLDSIQQCAGLMSKTTGQNLAINTDCIDHCGFILATKALTTTPNFAKHLSLNTVFFPTNQKHDRQQRCHNTMWR